LMQSAKFRTCQSKAGIPGFRSPGSAHGWWHIQTSYLFYCV